MKDKLAIKGNLVYSPRLGELACRPQAYLFVEDGRIVEVADEMTFQWSNVPLRDYGDALVIPGLNDLHLHAPQYRYAGLGMDLPLLDWLQNYAYPEEGKYGDESYALAAYQEFSDDLRRSFTCRAAIFATVHNAGAALLAQLLAATGLVAYVGKVSMDANCPQALDEGAAAAAAAAAFLLEIQDRYDNIKPIITPRFLPSCSSGLLAALGKLAGQYKLPVQSHLAENLEEVNWVRKLEPKSDNYTDAYDRYGLLEGQPTVMAHCIYLSDAEMRLLKERGVFIAHCPASNMNIMSGVAPVRKLLSQGLKLGLATDVAGGAHLSMLRAIQDAVAASKLRTTLSEPSEKPLTPREAFYLATKGGGAFFGQVGSFEPGYACDLLVIDDQALHPHDLELAQRLERVIYLAEGRNLIAKYVNGKTVDLN